MQILNNLTRKCRSVSRRAYSSLVVVGILGATLVTGHGAALVQPNTLQGPGQFVNRWSHLCMDVTGTSSGARVDQLVCNDFSTYQWWYISDLGNGWYHVIPESSQQQCLAASGTTIIESTCSSTATSQQWQPSGGIPTYFLLKNRSTSKCAQVPDSISGHPLRLATCDVSDETQDWSSPVF